MNNPMTAAEVADLPSADASTGRVCAPLAAAGPRPVGLGAVRPSPHRERLSDLDALTEALRDGTDEMDRRIRAVLSYLDGPSGGRARGHGPRASGRTTSTPGGPAA